MIDGTLSSLNCLTRAFLMFTLILRVRLYIILCFESTILLTSRRQTYQNNITTKKLVIGGHPNSLLLHNHATDRLPCLTIKNILQKKNHRNYKSVFFEITELKRNSFLKMGQAPQARRDNRTRHPKRGYSCF